MPAFGVYPIADVKTAGDEVSSTYEGRHVTLLESELIHPTHADGLVDKGDPVVFGTTALQGVGVAFKSAAAATDLIAVDTEGIWIIDVNAADDGGNVAVEGGDRLYISITTAIVSKVADASTNIPFGYALGHIDAGSTETIAVKVHWDPIDNWILDVEKFYFGDSKDVSVAWDGTNLNMLPVTDNTGTFNIGNGTLSMDVKIFGLTAADYMLWDNSQSMLSIVNTALIVGDAYSGIRVGVTATDAHNEYGMSGYFQADIDGTTAGHCYGLGSWINTTGTPVLSAGNIIVPFEGGVYTGEAQAAARVVFGGQHQAVLTGAPASLHAWRLNATQTITAVIAAANPGSVAFQASAAETSTPIGSVPMFDIVGVGIGYVRLYDDYT